MNKPRPETWVEVWSKTEPHLRFTESLWRTNAHTRRAPYRLLPKDKFLGVDAAAYNAVLRVYPEAIELGTVAGGDLGREGESKFRQFVLWPLFAFLVFYSFAFFWEGGLFIGAMSLGVAYFVFCFISSGIKGGRSGGDSPVMINRRLRKICVLPYESGGFFRPWKKEGHGAVREYDWDTQVHGRIYRFMYARGPTLPQIGNELALLATRVDDLTEVETLVTLGIQSGTDDPQLSLWEHIRQYMDEGGPPLQPSDSLRERLPSQLPSFPDRVVAEAGGPALDEPGIRRQIDTARQRTRAD